MSSEYEDGAAHIEVGEAAALGALRVGLRQEVDDARVLRRRLAALGHEAELDEVARYLGVVARHQVGHVLDKSEPQVGREAAHQAPVEDAQPAVGGAQQVARVRVAVQHAAVKHHVHVGVHGQRGDARNVGLGSIRRAVEPLAIDPLRGEDAARARSRDDARREDAPRQGATCELFELRVEGHRVRRLLGVVELLH